VTERQ